jgi:hypothetical protein
VGSKREKALLFSEDEVDLMQQEANASCVFVGFAVEASLEYRYSFTGAEICIPPPYYNG